MKRPKQDIRIQRELLAILRQHPGKENAIGRTNLRQTLSVRVGSLVSDRIMRKQIEYARTNDREGALICSWLAGGYFLARTKEELSEFLQSERNRHISIVRRINAQSKAAGLEWPDEKQPLLFDEKELDQMEMF